MRKLAYFMAYLPDFYPFVLQVQDIQYEEQLVHIEGTSGLIIMNGRILLLEDFNSYELLFMLRKTLAEFSAIENLMNRGLISSVPEREHDVLNSILMHVLHFFNKGIKDIPQGSIDGCFYQYIEAKNLSYGCDCCLHNR